MLPHPAAMPTLNRRPEKGSHWWRSADGVGNRWPLGVAQPLPQRRQQAPARGRRPRRRRRIGDAPARPPASQPASQLQPSQHDTLGKSGMPCPDDAGD
jgi:hypothetical protein